MFLEKVFIRANPVAATNPSVDLAVYFESLCPDSIRSGWDFHMLSPVVICNFGFPVLIFTWDFVKLRFVSHDVPSAWRLFGQDLRISYKPFGKASVREAINCEKKRFFVKPLHKMVTPPPVPLL